VPQCTSTSRSTHQAPVHSPHLVGKLRARALDPLFHVHCVAQADDVRVAGSHALHQGAAVGDVEDDGQVRAGLWGGGDAGKKSRGGAGRCASGKEMWGWAG
jgi:hypothetical protein